MTVRQSLAPTYRKGWVDALLNKLSGDDTTTATIAPVLHLLGVTPPALLPTTVLADLTAAEAVFSGYGAVTPTLSGPAIAGPNADALLGEGSYLGHSTGTFTPDTVSGYYLVAGGNWVMAEVWAAPLRVPIGSEGDWLDLTLILPLSFTPAWS